MGKIQLNIQFQRFISWLFPNEMFSLVFASDCLLAQIPLLPLHGMNGCTAHIYVHRDYSFMYRDVVDSIITKPEWNTEIGTKGVIIYYQFAALRMRSENSTLHLSGECSLALIIGRSFVHGFDETMLTLFSINWYIRRSAYVFVDWKLPTPLASPWLKKLRYL